MWKMQLKLLQITSFLKHKFGLWSVFLFPPEAQKLQLSHCGCFLKYSHKRDCENDNVVFDIYSLVLTSISKLLSWEDKGCFPNCWQHKAPLYSDSSLSLTSTSIRILWERPKCQSFQGAIKSSLFFAL